MSDNKTMNFGEAAIVIKNAIIRSRYQAATLVNKELLGLYYAVGQYVSHNSRGGVWGQKAIKQISNLLQQELPGLRGFSEASIRRMRLFFEGWKPVFSIHPLSMDELQDEVNNLPIISIKDEFIDLSLLSKHLSGFENEKFNIIDFYKVGFTHHSEILAKEKSLDGRLFYISQCAAEFWVVETLKTHLRGELYTRAGTMPNNFLQTLPEQEQARRAIRSFKEEYFLDYINIEDDNYPEERVLELGIIANIKKFILSFGNKFCFIGNRYRVIVHEDEFYTDLLFFNRELRCLVAIELKRGEFKPAHLGQLNFYLSALDEYVKQEDEQPSIGILLCKEANRGVVEFAIRDYSKPMGVATYRTKNDMPEKIQKALPDIDDMRKLLEAAPDEPIDEVEE